MASGGEGEALPEPSWEEVCVALSAGVATAGGGSRHSPGPWFLKTEPWMCLGLGEPKGNIAGAEGCLLPFHLLLTLRGVLGCPS